MLHHTLNQRSASLATITPEKELIVTSIPEAKQLDVVADLEKDLRSKQTKDQIDKQSEQLGASGPILPDVVNGENKYLQQKAQKYAPLDPVKPSVSQLGDFNNLLMQMDDEQKQNNAIPRNQLMAMSYSTLFNDASQAERVIESQLTYNLAASSFGMNSLSEKNFRAAQFKNKLLDGSFL